MFLSPVNPPKNRMRKASLQVGLLFLWEFPDSCWSCSLALENAHVACFNITFRCPVAIQKTSMAKYWRDSTTKEWNAHQRYMRHKWDKVHWPSKTSQFSFEASKEIVLFEHFWVALLLSHYTYPRNPIVTYTIISFKSRPHITEKCTGENLNTLSLLRNGFRQQSVLSHSGHHSFHLLIHRSRFFAGQS
jgi:hypothetical protein